MERGAVLSMLDAVDAACRALPRAAAAAAPDDAALLS
jgi:hypothetical protein